MNLPLTVFHLVGIVSQKSATNVWSIEDRQQNMLENIFNISKGFPDSKHVYRPCAQITSEAEIGSHNLFSALLC